MIAAASCAVDKQPPVNATTILVSVVVLHQLLTYMQGFLCKWYEPEMLAVVALTLMLQMLKCAITRKQPVFGGCLRFPQILACLEQIGTGL